MPGKRSKPVMVIHERKKDRIMEMVCGGKNLTEVGRIVGLTCARISQIVAERRLEWAAKNEVVVGDHVAIEIARLDKIIEQADRTYQRSLKDAKKVVTSQSEMGESQTVTTEGQCGDMAALGVKLKAVEMKLKLLNAFPKEDKTEVNNVVQINWSDLSRPIPHQEVIDITPSSKIEDRITAELNSPKTIPLDKEPTNGDGKH